MNLNSTEKSIDAVIVIDGYVFFQAENNSQLQDVIMEATSLTGLARAQGHTPLIYTILHEYDHARLAQYGRMGHVVTSMNGNRPVALPKTVQEVIALIQQWRPQRLIIIGQDEALAPLCTVGISVGAEVVVWSTGEVRSPTLRPYVTWRLADLLPVAGPHQTLASGWLDAENLLISLKKSGLTTDAGHIFRALREIAETLGINHVTWQAWADWSRLRDQEGEDYQRPFACQGAKTHYQVSLPGKSTVDIAIVGALHEALQREDSYDMWIVGTGDGDFTPTVDAIHTRGKQVVAVAVRGSLNAQLAALVDRVFYLDDYLLNKRGVEPSAKVPTQQSLAALLAAANFLEKYDWTYLPCNHLQAAVPGAWVTEAVDEGLLCWRSASDHTTVVLNPNNGLTHTARQLARWLLDLLRYCYQKENPFPYVDTALLQKRAQASQAMQNQPFISDRQTFLHFLEAMAAAGLIQKEEMPHPKSPERTIFAWRLPA